MSVLRDSEDNWIMLAGEIVAAWFDAHQTGDVERARQLLAPRAPIVIGDIRLRGFDELRSWYTNRATDVGPDFDYQQLDLMSSDRHVAVLLDLTDGLRHWRQVSVYEISGEQISSIWAVESDVEQRPARVG